MGLESNLTESRVDSESKKRLDSNFDNLDSNTESKQLTESTTPKNPSEALLNTNNSACASASRAQLQNCAIFATQKSNKMCRCDSTNRHSPASWCAIVEKRRQQCLRNDCARSGKSEALPPKDILCGCRKDPTGCKQSAAKKRRFIFFGAGESAESSADSESKTHTKSKGIPKSEQGQNLSNAEFGESKADSQSRAFTESKVEILKSVELKEVLKNEPIQNLTPQKPKQIKNPKSRLSKPHAECPLLLFQKHQNQGLGDEKNETMRGIVRFCGPCEFCVCF